MRPQETLLLEAQGQCWASFPTSLLEPLPKGQAKPWEERRDPRVGHVGLLVVGQVLGL